MSIMGFILMVPPLCFIVYGVFSYVVFNKGEKPRGEFSQYWYSRENPILKRGAIYWAIAAYLAIGGLLVLLGLGWNSDGVGHS